MESYNRPPSIDSVVFVSAQHPRRVMNRGIPLRGLLTPRSVPSPGYHARAGQVYAARRLIHGSSRRHHEALATPARLPEAEPVPVQTPRDRVTVNDIKERRAKAGKLVAGVAAYCDSDMFKAPVSSRIIPYNAVMSTKEYLKSVGKPKAKRWDRTFWFMPFLSSVSDLY